MVGVEIKPEGVEEYCERHTTALTDLHDRLMKETQQKTTTANYLVGNSRLARTLVKSDATKYIAVEYELPNNKAEPDVRVDLDAVSLSGNHMNVILS
jgi:hypothetical protein